MDTQIISTTCFRSGSGTEFTLSETIQRIAQFVGDSEFTLQVGTDSQTNGHTRFVTAIAVCKPSKGGIFFYHIRDTAKIPWLRDRIYNETSLSISCATELIDLFLSAELFPTITIHCDVGQNGKTRELIREITGYVTSSGFDYKIKPDSYVASSVADKLTK